MTQSANGLGYRHVADESNLLSLTLLFVCAFRRIRTELRRNRSIANSIEKTDTSVFANKPDGSLRKDHFDFAEHNLVLCTRLALL